jgi:hypothetical protein
MRKDKKAVDKKEKKLKKQQRQGRTGYMDGGLADMLEIYD